MADEAPNRVRDGLYIGSRLHAENKELLKNLNISHILSVAAGEKPIFPKDFTYYSIEVLDLYTEDLISHFESCISYINNARLKGGSVLVHCIAGMSRSATIVIAYLMKEEGLSFEEALEEVRKARPDIQPNEGFIVQLRAFHRMGCTVDTNNDHYQMLMRRLKVIGLGGNTSSSNNANNSSNNYNDINTNDGQPVRQGSTGGVNVGIDTVAIAESAATKEFCCKMCRTTLFNTNDIIPHQAGKGKKKFAHKGHYEQGATECSAYFLEPLDWMEANELEGKLFCKKCNHRVGNYNWSGMQCSCGVWVTPALQCHKSRVEQRVLLNLHAANPHANKKDDLTFVTDDDYKVV